MKMCSTNYLKTKRMMRYVSLSILLLLMGLKSFQQDGNTGINEANAKVRSYFRFRYQPDVCSRCIGGINRGCQGISKMEQR